MVLILHLTLEGRVGHLNQVLTGKVQPQEGRVVLSQEGRVVLLQAVQGDMEALHRVVQGGKVTHHLAVQIYICHYFSASSKHLPAFVSRNVVHKGWTQCNLGIMCNIMCSVTV